MMSISLPTASNGFIVEIASEEQYDSIVDHITNHFMRGAPLNKAMGTADDPECVKRMRVEFQDFLPRCVTLLAVEESSGQIAGLAVLKFSHSSDEGSRKLTNGLVPVQEVTNEKLRKILQIRRDLLGRVNEDLFLKYETDLIADLAFLSVSKYFGNRGVASQLVESTLEVAKKRGAGAITGEFSSNFSQSIARKFGLHVLAEIRYEDFKMDGEWQDMSTPCKLSINLPQRFDGFRIEIASDEQHGTVLDHVIQHFFREEPMNKSLGTADDQETVEEIRERLKTFLPHCVCLMVVEEATGNMVGLAMLLFARSSDKHDRLLVDGLTPLEEIKNSKRKAINEFRRDLLDMVKEDLFVKYETDLIVDLCILSVSQDFRKRGIASRLVDSTLDIARKRGAGAIKGEFSSMFSQDIARKIGLQELAEIRYDEYKKDGKVVFENTGPHESIKFMARGIQ